MKRNYNANRISGIPESIFTTMSRLAFEYKAINLGQGFPDFDGPDWLMTEVASAMKKGYNQYAPSPGIFSLRKTIAEVQKKYYDLNWNPESEITITAGATEALFSTMQAFIQPNDEVIIFEPYYDAYTADVLLAGGKPVVITLHKPDFKFIAEDLFKAISPATKMIIINTPHNPTGKIFTLEELELISKIAIDNDLLVVSDEVYEFMTFDGMKHIPIATLKGMKDRTITISSAGKTFGMTGWKIGFVCANEKLTNAIRSVHQWTTFAVNTPMQHAVAFGFSNLEDYLPEFRNLYQSKRDLIIEELKSTSFKPITPYGSYFIMVEIPEGIFFDDYTCAVELVKTYGIATIPPSMFYSNSNEGKTMLRLCFAKQDETIKAGIDRLRKLKIGKS